MNDASSHENYTKIKVELIKLAIIKKFGGVWIDLPFFPLQNFDWIVQLNLNSRDIMKMSDKPNILLFYNPFVSSYHLVEKDNRTVRSNSIFFESNFIAAEK